MLHDLTVNLIALRIVTLFIIAPIQRLAVVAAAVALGDPGPKYDGELSFDLLRHLDVFGALSTIVFGIGWSKMVTVDATKLRPGRAGVVVIIIAAFAALVLTAFVMRLLVTPALTMLPDSAAITVSSFLRLAAEVGLWFALLGLIPIPPLPGGLLLTAFGVRVSRQVQWILSAALALAVATGLVRQLLGPADAALASLVLGE